MRYSSATLPDHVLRLMPKDDRAALGKSGRTIEECATVATHTTERVFQTHMVQLLDQRGLFFSRARMDKKTTTRVGMFDFTVYLPNGRYLAVEAKVDGGALSGAQQELFTEFWTKTGQVVHIVLNLEQFRALLDANT